VPGLVPGTYVFRRSGRFQDVDGRDKPGHGVLSEKASARV